MGIFSGIVDAVKGGISGFASGGWMGAATGAIGGLAGAADAAVPAASAAYGQNQTNQMNQDMFNQGNAFNAQQAELARQFNAQQAGQSRDFSAAMWGKDAEFNEAEAQKNRDFQERMSGTQYVRAVQDMKNAGLNPMLAYSQGGAGTPSGGAASAGTAGSATASGPSAGAANVQRMDSALGAATNTGITAARLQSDLANNAASRELINAQTAKTLKGVDTEVASAYQIKQSGDKIAAEIPNVRLQLEQIGEQVSDTHMAAQLKQYQMDLTKAQTDYTSGKIGLVELQKSLTAAQIALSNAALPQAQRSAEMYQGPAGSVIPYIAPVVNGASALTPFLR